MSTISDDQTVNLSNAEQVKALAKQFNVTVDDIVTAVEAVGTLVKDVKKFVDSLKHKK